jgi:dihydrofolate reductase
MRVSAIAIITKNKALGKDGGLLLHVPGDLPRFKKLTLGHPVIMGRRTFESKEIHGVPLPGRMNIVVTRNKDYKAEGVVVCGSLNEAIQKARENDGDEAFVIGGGQIYREAWPFIDKLYLTVVNVETEGDVFFPEYSDFGRVILREEHAVGEMKYSFLELEK